MSDLRAAQAATAPPSMALAVLLATVVAGSLDLGYAIGTSALRGVAPTLILQSVAGGLLGKAAFEGGAASALLGAALHYAIMACAVLVFVLCCRQLPRMLRHPLLWGAAFGVVMFVVMNYVVVPLSAIGHPIQRPPLRYFGELASHVFFVGLPIAWFIARASRRPPGD